jgi:hypothetical protein
LENEEKGVKKLKEEIEGEEIVDEEKNKNEEDKGEQKKEKHLDKLVSDTTVIK